ncbi:conserved hypothetical protein [Photorhabdus asymbiotica]|uniref:Uncharacterized protein n=1 Tax=Photorhabdus asymbiotica subsp. asymbiotica (strain ATCC 43949 / 3105-77) TaxID=553480 RepID=C7BRW6_PHOAA|nr:conserved hypothetical protein [Photorhabdus asymbiotica]
MYDILLIINMKKIYIILLATILCIFCLLSHVTLGCRVKIAAYFPAILSTFLLLNEIIMEVRKVLILFLGIVTLIYASMSLIYGSPGFSSYLYPSSF